MDHRAPKSSTQNSRRCGQVWCEARRHSSTLASEWLVRIAPVGISDLHINVSKSRAATDGYTYDDSVPLICKAGLTCR
jgi:hypothetical protein